MSGGTATGSTRCPGRGRRAVVAAAARSRGAVLAATTAVMLALALSGCTGGGEPDTPLPTPTVDGVLPASALPDTPAAASTADSAEGATTQCGYADGGASLTDQAYRWQVINYTGVNGDKVTSAAYQLGNPEARRLLELIRTDFRAHCQGRQPDSRESETEAGPLPGDQFGYTVRHSPYRDLVVQRFAVKGPVLLQITVYHDGPGPPSVPADRLMAKALNRVH